MKLQNELKHIETSGRKMRVIVLRPEGQKEPLPGILWIHGGGYTTGMAGMVFFSCGQMLAEKFGAVVVSPEYRLAPEHRYPAALNDCYAALCMMYDEAESLGIRRDKIIVGGESAGGGLAAAVCLYARDMGKIRPAMQIPLYPMLDCEDTPSSADNHGHVWDTKRNHKGWADYLGDLYGTDRVPKYASPSRETEYAGLPPAYSYVEDGEPFYCETLTYIDKLKAAGIDAHADVFHGNIHAFDALFWTENSKEARNRLCDAYRRIIMEDGAQAPDAEE